MERTFVMVKPDGVQRGLVGKILQRIEEKGFKIVAMKLTVMPVEKAKEHYAEHVGKKFYQDLVDFITSGPSVSLVVEGRGAISAMRKMNGATNPAEAAPGTLRGDFAIETGRNVVHGSDSAAAAAREIALHFSASELVDYKRIDEGWLYE
ncbi:MAG: Nucleoside diphosphate kinase [Methanosaeta sp. PtaB.Bin018]|jgi:nucleoside-diphosphate kinase|nr:nucleoside-diphosphate kinase [Methanothrix sp.]OPX76953.1 MAG: Nucleoside diphosphate kinase [Methanosaeta sp. PtaB.Bin018]OPY47090.1 MAG: Nucleoside diphosphate kinase [Methanosaeta sp. PtaU1.Bin016]HOV51791.1 nucleoside-diphosphate kinase [Methanothrix sp.]